MTADPRFDTRRISAVGYAMPSPGRLSGRRWMAAPRVRFNSNFRGKQLFAVAERESL